jgi:hypothetical protein
MLLDKWVSYDAKVGIAVVCAGMWIYFRTESCYNMIPRQHIFPVVFVMGWTYLNYYEPLFLPVGLSVLVLYAYGRMTYASPPLAPTSASAALS